MNIETAQYLASYGIKPSVQRLAVMKYLLLNPVHPTAEHIYEALLPSMPTLSRTTVYNTLSLLAERGAILRLDLDPRQAHFDGNPAPHTHYVCTRCGAIFDAALQDLPPGSSPEGFTVSSTEVVHKGICKNCNRSH